MWEKDVAMVTAIKRNILRLGRWAENNQTTIIFFVAGVILAFTLVWCASLLFAFYMNGLWGYHFELNAAYGFLGIMSTAISTLIGLAWTYNSKYKIDSQLNSPEGELPKHNGNDEGG